VIDAHVVGADLAGQGAEPDAVLAQARETIATAVKRLRSGHLDACLLSMHIALVAVIAMATALA